MVDECPFNWKTFLEIYLELYHVEPFHPGCSSSSTPGNYKWGFGERWSYQILGIKDELKHQVSPHYTRYRNAILAYGDGKLPKYGTAVVHPLPERHAGVVPVLARGEHAGAALARPHH